MAYLEYCIHIQYRVRLMLSSTSGQHILTSSHANAGKATGWPSGQGTPRCRHVTGAMPPGQAMPPAAPVLWPGSASLGPRSG
ncbi:hypothetical protein D3C75_1207210 [compost metagenome]